LFYNFYQFLVPCHEIDIKDITISKLREEKNRKVANK